HGYKARRAGALSTQSRAQDAGGSIVIYGYLARGGAGNQLVADSYCPGVGGHLEVTANGNGHLTGRADRDGGYTVDFSITGSGGIGYIGSTVENNHVIYAYSRSTGGTHFSNFTALD